MTKPSLIARCTLSEQCLPDAPYRAMLCALHKDMLDEIDRLKALAEEAIKCATEALADPDHPAAKAAMQHYGAQPASVPLTERELELIDGMIEVQLRHAEQCDGIANRTMAARQKGWDMKRIALLKKLKEKNT